MFRKRVESRRLLGLTLCAVGLVVGGAGTTRAQFGSAGVGPKAAEQQLFPNGLPKIETMLKSALEHHPDVLAARSKLRMAEAEQRQAELKAFKDLMEVRDRWEKARRSVVELNLTDPSMGENLSRLAAIEWELTFLLGSRSETRPLAGIGPGMPSTTLAPTPIAPGSLAALGNALQVSPAITELSVPRGDQAKTMKVKLSEKVEVSFEETPFSEVAEFLSEKSGLRFILDQQNMDEGAADSPITLKLGELELGAVLQALEDVQSPICFIVRDYGILVTTHDSQPLNSVTARDFWKLTEDELREKLRLRRFQMNMGGGGMGGMGGGMGGQGGMGGGFY